MFALTDIRFSVFVLMSLMCLQLLYYVCLFPHSSLNGNGDTILHLALRLPNVRVIEKILAHEKVCTLASIRNNENMKPIQLSVRYNKLEALKQLITLAPKCSAINSPENHYLLHIAAEKGHYQMAHFLIEDNYKFGKY